MDSYREKLLLAASPNTSLRGSVQMMTIHKSKGLDFDIVIMPELNFREAGRNSHALMVAKDENFRTSFITFLPKTPYASTFSIFREEMEKNALSDAYEMCCNLYVGMTRARYALYLFADKKSKNSTTYQQREILYETFGKQGAPPELFPEEACFHHPEQNDLEKPKVIAYTGDPLWYEKLKKSEKKKSPILTERSRELVRKCLLKYTPGKVEIIRNSAGNFVTPSSCHDFGTGEKFRFHSDSSYTFKSSGNTALGTRVHQILENFLFSGNIGKEEFFRKYLQKEELTANSPIPHLLEGFFSPDSPVYQALLPPESGEKVVLWKEQEFLVTGREKEIISGTFDRVHLIEEKDGLRAEILDFKTDHLTDADEFLSRYSRQLDLYRTALSIMQHLPPEKISCYILALTPGLCIKVK